jgi:spore maturation protein CgeB
VLFLERDLPWYAGNRDQPNPEGAVAELYSSVEDLVQRFENAVSGARLVILGSFVRDGAIVADWITSVARGRTAFYDIDTPITLARLESGDGDYITRDLIRRFDLYLSFTGGPALRMLESRYGARLARPLYCSADSRIYKPVEVAQKWELGYLGTYSPDRQPGLASLLLEPARMWPQGRFAVVGPMYPDSIVWPPNVEREIHLSPREHAAFYGAQRFTLNITRDEMKRVGYSPSVRLFEAGACAAPVISDYWDGLDQMFAIGKEVLVAEGSDDTLRFLRDIPDSTRRQIGYAARKRVLEEHTPEHRAQQLESYLKEADDNAALAPARRHGRGWQVDHGLAAGLPSERQGESASGGPGGQTGAAPDPRNIYESPGASLGNSNADRKPAQAGAAALE